ncbi:DUF2886 domain containing protein [Sulfitobacter noctilucicola]|uniref:Group 4 capsule polysaccharide lipoprotein gfcB, YjbF n=1 Tax=Sulfitobacter noctilucicola TaxID=1342301 RepID=A0A7W6Q2N9_9RHOB|nr:YjbF family lipoprotein [Sulfitobacter noctilucicola]KIN62719.1 DUF2886 domain containing protein [Sulfitobacter noctilucicola]MBB4172748.1 hypothetical protein [Sulfitobacter noctilucicola]
MKWNFGILAGAALFLAACSASNLQDRAISLILDEEPAVDPSVQFPRFTPLLQAKQGPALQVSIPAKNLKGGFLRESSNGNIESWLGNDGVSLTFDRGVLHGTRGIGAGMLASDVSASASAVLAGRNANVKRVHTFLTGNDLAVSQVFSCRVENRGTETISLDTGATSTRRMSENCQNDAQSFENTYWVDTRRGRIVKSIQWSGEFLGALSIQTVYNF